MSAPVNVSIWSEPLRWPRAARECRDEVVAKVPRQMRSGRDPGDSPANTKRDPIEKIA
jgi:hypothetical protein